MVSLEKGAKTAHDVTPDISWNITYKTWEQFPVGQKYFAIGETVAHLQYLAIENKIRQTKSNGKTMYSLL